MVERMENQLELVKTVGNQGEWLKMFKRTGTTETSHNGWNDQNNGKPAGIGANGQNSGKPARMSESGRNDGNPATIFENGNGKPAGIREHGGKPAGMAENGESGKKQPELMKMKII